MFKEKSKLYFDETLKRHILMTVKYGLEDCYNKNQLPYFSITATGNLANKAGGIDTRYKDPMVFSGCCHEIIQTHFPELEPLIRLHLSNINGKPLYAFENGYYFLKNKKHNNFRKHLRLSQTEADAIIKAYEENKNLTFWNVVLNLI